MPRFDHINTDDIIVDEGIRKSIDEKALDELVASIKEHGILQPIIVETTEDEHYKLHIGSRRTAAARVLGLEKVPALILEDSIETKKSLEIMIVENLQREDLDPIDEAEAYDNLRGMGVKVSEIARRVGKARTYVSHSMRLLKLHPKIREAVRQNNIPREHALALLRLEPEQQLELAEEVIEKGLTTTETRNRVREFLGKELKWRLVPIRIEPSVYKKLESIAPDGDVEKLLMQAIDEIASEMNTNTI